MALSLELKSKWLQALRSGNYKQGRGALHNSITNTFCCLGVLRQVEPALFPVSFKNECILDDAEVSPLGLSRDEQFALAIRNDGGDASETGRNVAALTFPEIADYIEANL